MPDLDALAACASARWSPGIGDPTVMGWITVAAYLLAALLAALVLRRSTLAGRERVFWAATLLAMLALGINKELDLQSAVTAAGRCAARQGGWYEARKPVQFAFILAVAAGGALMLLLLGRLLRGTLRRNGLALLGLVLIAVFVAIRAAGFHHVDALIGWRVAGWRMNWILELGGIALVALGALHAGFRREGAPAGPDPAAR